MKRLTDVLSRFLAKALTRGHITVGSHHDLAKLAVPDKVDERDAARKGWIAAGGGRVGPVAPALPGDEKLDQLHHLNPQSVSAFALAVDWAVGVDQRKDASARDYRRTSWTLSNALATSQGVRTSVVPVPWGRRRGSLGRGRKVNGSSPPSARWAGPGERYGSIAKGA